MYTKLQPPCASVTDAGTCIQQQQRSVILYWALLQLSSLSASQSSLSLCFCVCLSLPLAIFPSACISVSVFQSVFFSDCPSMFPSVSLFSVSVSLWLSLFISPCLSVSLSFCLCISVSLCLSLSYRLLSPTNPYPSLVLYLFPPSVCQSLSLSPLTVSPHPHSPRLKPHPSLVLYPFFPWHLLPRDPAARMILECFSLALTFPSSTQLQVLQTAGLSEPGPRRPEGSWPSHPHRVSRFTATLAVTQPGVKT